MLFPLVLLPLLPLAFTLKATRGKQHFIVYKVIGMRGAGAGSLHFLHVGWMVRIQYVGIVVVLRNFVISIVGRKAVVFLCVCAVAKGSFLLEVQIYIFLWVIWLCSNQLMHHILYLSCFSISLVFVFGPAAFQVGMALVVGSFARLVILSPQQWHVVSEHNFIACSRSVRRGQLVEVVGFVPVLG